MAVDAALIAGVDAYARRLGGLRNALSGLARRATAPRAAGVIAALAVLAAALVPAWVTDYSYRTQRSTDGPWKPSAQHYLHRCRYAPEIRLPMWSGHAHILNHVTVPCTRLTR